MKILAPILILLAFKSIAQNSTAKIESIKLQNSYSEDVLIVTFDEPLQRIEPKNISISVEPAIECFWSWIDQYNLACNLNDYRKYEDDDYEDGKNLTLATQYVFNLNEGLIDLQDRKVQPQAKEFNYKRPKATKVRIMDWESPLVPILAIYFNQKIDHSNSYSKLFLTSDNQSIPVKRVLRKELSEQQIRFDISNRTEFIIVKPSNNLDLNKEYKLSLIPGIKSKHGLLESLSQTFEKPIQAIEDFKFLNYTCNDNRSNYEGPCYSDDRMSLSFSSIIDKYSLEKCLNYNYKNIQVRPVGNKSVLTIYSSQNDKLILANCFHELRDVFSRKLIQPKEDELPKSKGIRPFLSINFPNNTLIPNTEEIDLKVSSTNLDAYYVTYEQVNNETINTSFHVDIDNKNDDDSIFKTLQLPLPESQIHFLKGFVSIVEQSEVNTQRIPFTIQKSPYQVNIKQNLNTILLQVNEIDSAKAIVGAEISLEYEGTAFTSITDEHGISEIDINDLVNKSDFKLSINHDGHSIKYPAVQNFTNLISKGGKDNYYEVLLENSFYLFGLSDKPIYRAGETVNYKIYMRQKNDINFKIPRINLPNFKISLNSNHDTCYDYDDCSSSYVLENPKLDEFGGISGQFTLPKSSKNGTYSIQAVFNNDDIESVSDLRFQVSDFKNSEYKLNLTSSIKHAKNNEAFPVVATAEYYSGGHVTDGKGEIAGEVNSKRIESEYPEYSSYDFETSNYNDYEGYYLKDLTYDKNGAIKTMYTPPENTIKFGSIKLNAGLKPEAGEWNYSQDLILPYRQQDYFLGLKLETWRIRPNEEINLETVFIDYLGKKQKPKAMQFFIKQKFNREWSDYKALVCSKKSKTNCTFNVQEWGSYKIKAVATKKKQTSTHEIGFSVNNYHSQYVSSINPEISIQSDKKSYKIGDTANISISFPEKINKALITAERNKILDKWSLETTTGYLEIKLPITSKHVPGFDVTVLTQQNNSINRLENLLDINQTSLNIHVDQLKHKNLFDMKTDKKVYQPKEKIKLNLHSLSDFKSEFTVAVIDQSIVDLIDSKMHYDLSESYYNLSKNYWDLYSNYQISAHNNDSYKIKLKKHSNYLEYENSNYYDAYEELDRITVTGSRITREDIGVYPNEVKSKSESDIPSLSIYKGNPSATFINDLAINPEDLRFVFAESAFFKTGIRFDPGQEKDIEILLPDNIGQWRIVVLGTDESGKLVINDLSVKASKDLELRSTLPVQLTETDHFVAQYSVISKTSKKVKIQAATQAKQNGSILETNYSKFKKVKKLQSKTLKLPVDNITQGEINLTALAKTKKNADGLFQTIPVRSKTTELSLSQYGQFNSATKLLELNKPKDANDLAEFSLVVSSSLLPYLQPVYDYMDNYAHSCWEQQSAKAIVSAIQLASPSGLSTSEVQTKKEQINSVLSHAFDFQAPNGGMTFFNTKNENVNLFLSLNTLSNFTFLEQLGYKVPNQVRHKLTQFINNTLLNVDHLPDTIYRYKSNQLTPQILLKAYRFANHQSIVEGSYNKEADKKELIAIKQNAFEKLSELSLATLTQLLYVYKEDTIKLKSVLKPIQDYFYSNDKKYFMKDSGFSPWYLMSSNSKDHCELMISLLELDSTLISKDDLLKHMNGVLEYRNTNGEFGNTLENQVCSQALFTFSQKYETTDQELNINLKVNEESYAINNGAITKSVSFNNDLKIAIENPNQTQTYFSSQLKYQVPSNKVEQQSNGFNIQREYFIFQEGNWKLAKSFKVGDWVKTRITIHSPISRNFVAVSDPVPGAWLPTDPELARNMPVGMRESLKHFDNSDFFYERQLNPATTRFYADYLHAGSHRISYLSQIRSEGSFSALPAIVEEMYDDDNRANTELLQIKVGLE